MNIYEPTRQGFALIGSYTTTVVWLSQLEVSQNPPGKSPLVTTFAAPFCRPASRTNQVTCISPPSAFAEETVNSLNYAQKAGRLERCLERVERGGHQG